jgi:hypothetical protein
MLFGGREEEIVAVAGRKTQRLLGVEELDLESPAESWWGVGRAAESRI